MVLIERFLQFLLSVRAWIRKIHRALPNHSESEHKTDELKRNEEFPGQPIRAVISFDDEKVRTTQTEAERQYANQKSIKYATWTAVIAACVYAFISFLQWHEMAKTTKAAQEQLALMRDADRPWIDMNIFVTSPLTYDSKTVRAEFTFVPTNIGRSPAGNIAINPMLKPAFMFDDLNEMQKHLCDIAATEVGMASLKYVLFPGHHYNQPVGLELSVEDINSHWGKLPPGVGPSDAIPIALVVCVDYTYESSNRHHQTAFAVDVLTKDGMLPLKSKTPITPSDLILRVHPTTGHYPN